MDSIKIKGPVFNSSEDENMFFQCIYNLPDFKDVIGSGTVLTITFQNTISEKATKQIHVLCDRWDTTLDY